MFAYVIHRFVGEWNVTGIELPFPTDDESHQNNPCFGVSTEEQCDQIYADQRETSSTNFYIAGGIYMVFLVLSSIMTVVYSLKKKR